ncbi:MAG: L,D-transpeptidase, partial [Deltaproteobacteria bacterium]|nr:L,D-transpeptidase [Deltaproteobacteria bacterium]
AFASGDGGATDAGGPDVRRLTTEVMVTGGERVEIAGRPLLATSHGLVDERALARLWPSAFSGVDLAAPGAPALPFGWVHASRFEKPPLVRSEPARDAPRVRRAKRREVVPVLEERDGHVLVGPGEWIARGALRVARVPTPPSSAAPGAAFIDVDLDEQVLVAHDGTAPRFATLISTGKPRHRTPPGLYRILAKAATTEMAGPEDHPRRYEVAGVPWALRFHERGLYLHGAYWHDAFGAVISHGCVNLAPRDAHFLFDWAAPALPPGWSEVEVEGGEGLLVQIRDREHPDPAAPGDGRGSGP